MGTQSNVAVAKGIWTAGDFIDPSVNPPYEYIGNGVQSGGGAENGTAFWQTLLSVETFEAESTFSIAPNPASTVINIKFSTNLNNGSIALYDMLGKQVLIKDLNGNNEEILDVSNLTNGIYLLKIDSGNQSQTKRVIIQ